MLATHRADPKCTLGDKCPMMANLKKHIQELEIGKYKAAAK
jgi:hypothetical protein